MTDILSEVKKPLTERGWKRVDSIGYGHYKKNSGRVYDPIDARFQQAYWDQPAFIDRLEELEAERRWIPVEERLPEEANKPYLTFRMGEKDSTHIDFFYCLTEREFEYEKRIDKNAERWWFAGGGGLKSAITHWQPLPSPPDRAQERRSE